MLQNPNHPGENAGSRLQRRRVIERRQLASLSDCQPGTIPINAGRVATKQHPQLVHARRKLLFDYTPMRLQVQTPAGKFMD